MKTKIAIGILSLVIAVIGLYIIDDAKLAFGVILLIWSNNIGRSM